MADAGFILCEISHNAGTMLANSLPNIVPALGKRFVFDVFVSVLDLQTKQGGGPRVVVSTAAFHARVRNSVPGLGGMKETKNVSSPSTCESQYCGEPP